MSSRTAAILVLACVAASACLPPASASARDRVPQQTMPDLTAPAPDGVLFTETRGYRDGTSQQWVARITPEGAVTATRARLPPPWPPALLRVDPSLTVIAAGLDGGVWFAGESAWIGRLGTDGAVTRFPIRPDAPGVSGGVDSIVAMPDGGLWFIGTVMGRMSPDGAVTPVSPPRGMSASDLTAGPGGDLWFVYAVRRPGGWGEGIARMSTSGAVTRLGLLAAPSWVGQIANLTNGPDGNLWFTQGRWIGRITPSGQVRRFSAGIGTGAVVQSLASAPDGNLWFTVVNEALDAGTGPIGRMTPGGAVRLFRTGVEAWDITAGPDGNLWFAESNGERIGRMTPAGVVSEFPPTPRMTPVVGRGPRGIVVGLRCPVTAPFECGGTVTLQDEDDFRPHRYGAARFALAPGAATMVRVPLWTRGRRLLAARGTLPVVAVLRPRAARTGSLGGSITRRVVLGRPAATGSAAPPRPTAPSG
jgi:streptogramin lyase